jgi:hypothetical protein
MELIFRNALKSGSTYLREEDWGFYMPATYRRCPGVVGKALVLQNWPNLPMSAITASARTLLEAGDCNAVVLEIVNNEYCVQELEALGWTNYYSILTLKL